MDSPAPEPGSGRRRIALLAPMPAELRPLLRRLSLRRSGDLHVGALGRLEVVATTSGIGTRLAARAAERLLAAGAVEHLVVVGIAGGIGPAVSIGDVVVPERVVDRACGTVYRPAPLGDRVPRGTLLTADALLTDPLEAARLAAEGAVAIDMETAAVAAVCERIGCPWSVFRAISDRADDGTTDAAVLALARPDGRADGPAVARFLITRPWRVPQLVRLGRGMRRATGAAACAALEALAGMRAG